MTRAAGTIATVRALADARGGSRGAGFARYAAATLPAFNMTQDDDPR